MEDTLINVLENEEGKSIGRQKKLNYTRFADDTVIFAYDSETLRRIIIKLEEGMKNYGMKINVVKTKIRLRFVTSI